MDSEVLHMSGSRLYDWGKMLEAGTIHTVMTTTDLQDNGLKLTLVATFFTVTIFKMLSAVLTALRLYPADL